MVVDLDGLFDEKLAEYIEGNKGKYKEKQWEDAIPKLYQKFGDTYLPKLGCTPKEYYQKMADGELVQTLSDHLSSGVPVPEFLCDEIEKRNPKELLSLLESDNGETVAYAINLIGANPLAVDAYFKIVISGKDADLCDGAVENLKQMADDVKEKAFAYLEEGKQKELMLETLSRARTRDERIYSALISAFKERVNLPMRASYLAAYGDERALPLLLKEIERQEIGFVEFQELKYAIEALGGEYNEPRDFSSDDDFMTIEEASKKEGFPLS